MLAMLVSAQGASAAGWLPHPADASWTYQWTDSVYHQTPTNEVVTVKDVSGPNFRLDWTTEGAAPPGGPHGTVFFQDTTAGLINVGWENAVVPTGFPILCAAIADCANSLASSLFNVVWGARAPVLSEPLLKGTTWVAKGGAANDVTSTNDYLGLEPVNVPAFAQPVLAAKIRSQITQAGAIGDPYGSGVRTAWWVYGVGPVKIVFQHAGGSDAAVTTVLLEKTNQEPTRTPSDTSYFPMPVGMSGSYRWTNTKCMKTPQVETFKVTDAVNGTAIMRFGTSSGPMRIQAAYQLTMRLDGLTNVSTAIKGTSSVHCPPLGPKSLPPAKRRHFFTPFDLMSYGFDPIVSAYPAVGTAWRSDPTSRDFLIYGVTGVSKVTGFQTVKVPAGTFRALVVTSTLTQAGFPFGSGTRTMWFAPDKGLVKLVFRHKDGSTSLVERLR
jgi:hypothetical protein